MTIIKFEDIQIQPEPNHDYEFLLSGEDVAKGYGVAESTIRDHKSKNKSEILANVHFITSVGKTDAGKPPIKEVRWTRRGIVRLGFFIKSERAKKFRDFIENLVVKELEKTPKPSDWLEQRKSTAKKYTLQSMALERFRKNQGKETKPHHYVNEANRVNKHALKKTTKALQKELKGTGVRDCLSIQSLLSLEIFETINAGLLFLGHDNETRDLEMTKLHKEFQVEESKLYLPEFQSSIEQSQLNILDDEDKQAPDS